jgi:S1-C subfamily serine protease
VTLPGETTPRDADLVGVASDVDVAVLRAPGVVGLAPTAFADSDGAQVGQNMIAIGNALDLGDTMSVTRGITSALDRAIETDDATYLGLFRIDAAITSGNSGDALLDMSGAVIGMSSAAASRPTTSPRHSRQPGPRRECAPQHLDRLTSAPATLRPDRVQLRPWKITLAIFQPTGVFTRCR